MNQKFRLAAIVNIAIVGADPSITATIPVGTEFIAYGPIVSYNGIQFDWTKIASMFKVTSMITASGEELSDLHAEPGKIYESDKKLFKRVIVDSCPVNEPAEPGVPVDPSLIQPAGVWGTVLQPEDQMLITTIEPVKLGYESQAELASLFDAVGLYRIIYGGDDTFDVQISIFNNDGDTEEIQLSLNQNESAWFYCSQPFVADPDVPDGPNCTWPTVQWLDTVNIPTGYGSSNNGHWPEGTPAEEHIS